MSIDKATVYKIAQLARIRVTEEDVERLAPQLSNIMQFVEQLEEVNTDNVGPLANVVDITPRLRADVVSDGGIPGAVLANAPEEQEHYFVVPKVVE
ncbi:MAG: Asp-tRNA(Asn)/Glu-tRNA(Gln) amidotransferase subunit GatC [Alphaproteobacteria bacterium]|nr:Asp-tRNA(Asn)/Glu-tRNA(Gln) amidotransferase subunit GatC [Alphaproteobacteria bacterium]